MKQLTREVVIDALIDIRLKLEDETMLYDVLKEGTIGYDNLTNEELEAEYLVDITEEVKIVK